MSEAVDRFFYSEIQKQKYMGEPLVPKHRFARLLDGRAVEYTECQNIARLQDPEYANALPPHAERYPDSVYLGEGELERIEYGNSTVTCTNFPFPGNGLW